MKELQETLKNIEAVLLRLESRLKEKYPTWAECQKSGKEFVDALMERCEGNIGKQNFNGVSPAGGDGGQVK